MLTRRAFIGAGVAAAAISVPIIGSALRSKASAATQLAIRLVNQTGQYANNQMYAYIVGVSGSTQCYVTANGTLTPVSLSLNGSDGFADLSIPFAASGDTTLSLPKMSGRIYLSIGQKLKFKVVTDGNGNPALQYPAGWVSTDPSYQVLHDWMEFTFNDAGMFCNSTMVDMFSIPLALTLTGAQTQTTGALVNGGRDAIFAALAALPDFAPLVIGNKLRVIAPGHGIDSGVFSSTYFDSYVNQVWSTYASSTMTVNTGSTTYTGRVTGNQLVFSGGVAPFNKPTTKAVFYCNDQLSAPNDGVTGPVAAILGAGFNRSTLVSHTGQPTTDPSTFYQTSVTNHYAQVMHQNSADAKAYGFAFDDVAGFASYIQDTAPTALTITLGPFGAGVITSPTPTPTVTTSPTAPAGGRDAYATIQAESFNAQSGTQTETTADTGGGQDVGWIANGDWLRYDGVNFGSTAATQFKARVASGAAGGVSGLVQVRLDSLSNAPIGSFALANTGGWQTWQTVPANISAVTGTHTVFVTFSSGQPADFVNLNWLTFSH
jgi:hypothetical protein